ncbi:MAG: GatB/YqeY domain-containing protein [Candidatus Omnitrophica bacterium]|nr:GatB/YqeY domain-containing protein [Candidatus Omnitrophota bacterium]
MTALQDRIEADYKTALKAGERLRVDTLRLIKAGMQRTAIDKRKETLDEAEITQVLIQQAKQRRETIESVKNTPRQDVLSQATEELAILTAYLPQQLSSEEIAKIVDEAITAVGANQGPIMKYVMSKASGSADGKLVSQIVADRLKAKSAS